MWSNTFRFCVFVLVYQRLFYFQSQNDFELDYPSFAETLRTEFSEQFLEQLETENEIRDFFVTSKGDLEYQVLVFEKNYEDFCVILRKELISWDKTFDIIKAFLFCFLLEKDSCEDKSKFNVNSIGTYIQFAEEFVVSANVKLIHAVLAKLI